MDLFKVGEHLDYGLGSMDADSSSGVGVVRQHNNF